MQKYNQQSWLLKSHWNCWGGIFDLEKSLARFDELNALAEDPNLWNEPKKAQSIMRERTHLDQAIRGYRELENGMRDNVEMISMAEVEGDQLMVSEAESNLFALRELAGQRELESLLSGEADANACYLEINAGAGGTEAQDWAQMLTRMYIRWAEKHDYKVEWLDESKGEEAGIKSATKQITGHNA